MADIDEGYAAYALEMKRLMTNVHGRLNATAVAIAEYAAAAEAECSCDLVAVGELVVESRNLKSAVKFLAESIALMDGPAVPRCTTFDQPTN